MANSIPKTEKIWTHIFTSKNEEYFITSKLTTRDIYFIYKKTTDGVEKLGKSVSPKELEKKYIKV